MGSLFPSAAFGSRHPKGTPLPIDLGKSMFNSRGKTDKKTAEKLRISSHAGMRFHGFCECKRQGLFPLRDLWAHC